MPKEFRTYFKEDIPKKVKKTKQQMWNDMKAKSFKKSISKNKEQIDADKEFFIEAYTKFYNEDNWRCCECQCPLPMYNGTDESYKVIRSCIHHCISKSSNQGKQLRHNFDAVVPVCSIFVTGGNNCHAKFESAISYPRMKSFAMMEEKKKLLLQ